MPARRLAPNAAVALAITLLTSCSLRDPEVPWDTAAMVRTLSAELPRFEGLQSDLMAPEVLGWFISEQNGFRLETALLWARVDAGNQLSWVLVQGFRHPTGDNVWRRSWFATYPKAPLRHTRPGEDTDGTWHAFQRYSSPPSASQICEFAAVDFLNLPAEWRRISGGLRRNAWRRVTRSNPSCEGR